MANVAPQLDPISAASIDYQRQLAEALRQQQYGQLMQNQGLQKMDFDPKGTIHWSQGLAKMLQSYLGAKDLRQSDETMAELKAKAGQNQMKMFGMGEEPQVNQPSPQQEAPQQQETPQQPMQFGMPTPEQQNARVNGYQSPNQPQPMPQPAPQQLAQAVKNYPMRLSGDPGKDYMMYIQNPEAFSKAMIEQNTPIAEVKRARDLGIGLDQYSDAEKRELNFKNKTANQQAGLTPLEDRNVTLAKALKEAEVARKPGEMTYNYANSQTSFLPQIPSGTQPTAISPNGRITAVAPIAGANQALANTTAAVEGAKVGEQVMDATGAYGEQVKGRTKDVIPNAGFPSNVRVPQPANSGTVKEGQSDRVSILQQELQNEKDPKNRAMLEREIKNVSSVIRGPVAGATDQQKTLFSRNDQVKQDVVPNKQDIDALDKIGTLATQGVFGPGTSTSARWKAIAANLPGYGFVPIVPGVDETKADATNQAILKKLMSQMASRVSTGGTDARLQSALDQLPNSEMTNEAILHVVPMLKAQKAASIVDAQLRSKIDPTDVKAINAHENQWREAYDPRVFELQTMPPAQQMQYIKSLSPAEAAKLRDKRQKLMKMGAFGG